MRQTMLFVALSVLTLATSSPLRAEEEATPKMACDATTQPKDGKLPKFETVDKEPENPDDYNGWVPAGPPLAKEDNVLATESRMYTWTSEDKKTMCTLLYRKGEPNQAGVICYDVATCQACAYNGAPKDTIGGLENKDMDCANCHPGGPILPKKKIWGQGSTVFAELSLACAAAGGPAWNNIEGPKPNPKGVVPAPDGCSGTDCHKNGFAPWSKDDKCKMIVEDVLGEGGAMEGKKFADFDECKTFLTKLNCAKLVPKCANYIAKPK